MLIFATPGDLDGFLSFRNTESDAQGDKYETIQQTQVVSGCFPLTISKAVSPSRCAVRCSSKPDEVSTDPVLLHNSLAVCPSPCAQHLQLTL